MIYYVDEYEIMVYIISREREKRRATMKIKNLRTNTERDSRMNYLRETETAIQQASRLVIERLEQRVARLTK